MRYWIRRPLLVLNVLRQLWAIFLVWLDATGLLACGGVAGGVLCMVGDGLLVALQAELLS